MLPQSCEEAHLFYEGLVAYAAARSARQGSERVLLKAMNARHADIIVKLFQNAPENHAEVEEYFHKCIDLVVGERPGAQDVSSEPRGTTEIAERRPKKVIADLNRAPNFRS